MARASVDHYQVGNISEPSITPQVNRTVTTTPRTFIDHPCAPGKRKRTVWEIERKGSSGKWSLSFSFPDAAFALQNRSHAVQFERFKTEKEDLCYCLGGALGSACIAHVDLGR
jgi:hypothetical protein